MGRSAIASRIFNCAAPDTGNMEILAEFGNDAQKKKYLQPLLDGKIRSCFSMTEPEVSSADPTQLATLAKRDGDSYVLNGHKWFTTRRDRRGVRDRDGGDGSVRRAAPAREHDPGADDDARLQDRARGLGDGPLRRRRSLRDPLRGLPRAGREPARPRGRGLRDRAGAARSGAGPPLHALHRRLPARVRDHGRATPRAGRSAASRSAPSSSSRTSSRSRRWRSTRRGSSRSTPRGRWTPSARRKRRRRSR